MEKIEAETLTVMFVDMVSYTSTTSKLNTQEFNRLHDIFDCNISSIAAEYQGTIIKKSGDAFLITFKSSTNAVLC